MPVADELHFNVPGLSREENPEVRADMVYYPTPNGGESSRQVLYPTVEAYHTIIIIIIFLV